MTRSLKIVTALAALHLLLVLCGAFHVSRLPVPDRLGYLLAWYWAASGADTNYGFFAPRVAPQIEARFELTDVAGRTWQLDHRLGVTNEANLRFASTVSLMTREGLEPLVARCWAATLLGRYPEAVQVKMIVLGQQLPPMAAQRGGARTQWVPLYEGTFRRQDEAI